jgi:hypothetical protein
MSKGYSAWLWIHAPFIMGEHRNQRNIVEKVWALMPKTLQIVLEDADPWRTCLHLAATDFVAVYVLRKIADFLATHRLREDKMHEADWKFHKNLGSKIRAMLRGNWKWRAITHFQYLLAFSFASACGIASGETGPVKCLPTDASSRGFCCMCRIG